LQTYSFVVVVVQAKNSLNNLYTWTKFKHRYQDGLGGLRFLIIAGFSNIIDKVYDYQNYLSLKINNISFV
jgi:hypothetical protein